MINKQYSKITAGRGLYVAPSAVVSTFETEAGFAASNDYVSSEGNGIDGSEEVDYGTF